MALESLTCNDESCYLWDFIYLASENPLTTFQWLLACGKQLNTIRILYYLIVDNRFCNLHQAKALLHMGVECTLSYNPHSFTFLFKDALAKDLSKWRVHMASNGSWLLQHIVTAL